MAADNFVIPAYCEKLIDVFIDRYEDDQDLYFVSNHQGILTTGFH